MKLNENDIMLTEEEFKENVQEIFNELAMCASKTENPTFILVGGQAGAGKSLLTARENIELNDHAIIIDQDELRTKYPLEKYNLIHNNCTEREEFLLLKPYISRLIVEIKDLAKKSGYNIILESALRSVKSFIPVIEDLRKNGYSTKLSILSVPEIEGNISMLSRYCYFLEKYGECRRNTRIDPESVNKIQQNIEMLNDLDIFEEITVSKRGIEVDSLPEQVYSNKENPDITPIEAYIAVRDESYNDTKNNFMKRYEIIKKILLKNNEHDLLAKLEKIRESFEEKNRAEKE